MNIAYPYIIERNGQFYQTTVAHGNRDEHVMTSDKSLAYVFNGRGAPKYLADELGGTIRKLSEV